MKIISLKKKPNATDIPNAYTMMRTIFLLIKNHTDDSLKKSRKDIKLFEKNNFDYVHEFISMT